MSNEGLNGLMAGFRPMPRSLPALNNTNPSYTVNTKTRIKDRNGNIGGITFSGEDFTKEKAEEAQFEVLKSILLRENYLERLYQLVRTIAKKFKPEVADVLDLVRNASIDVVEQIENWRKIKDDPLATFMWNGVNYLLKMPSDLDYLGDYVAVQKWLCFSIHRNPFIIPYPMQQSDMTSGYEETADPKHITEGFSFTGGVAVGAGALSSSPKNKRSSRGRGTITANSAAVAQQQSFILNEDMRRIRRAEATIQQTEALHGIFGRDPDGRLVPLLQAITRKTAAELKKDDKRSLSEPSVTSAQFAPHAARSDIGIAAAAWTPDIISDQRRGSNSNDNNNNRPGSMDNINSNSRKDTVMIDLPGGIKNRPLVIERGKNDFSGMVNSNKRGSSLSGGALLPFEGQGSTSRRRKPIKLSISSAMDFQRDRHLGDIQARLDEISMLKAQLLAQHNDQQQQQVNHHGHSHIHGHIGAAAKEQQLVKSVASGQRLGLSQSISETAIAPPPPVTPGTQIYAQITPPDFFIHVEQGLLLYEGGGGGIGAVNALRRQVSSGGNNNITVGLEQTAGDQAEVAAQDQDHHHHNSHHHISSSLSAEQQAQLKELTIAEAKALRRQEHYRQDEQTLAKLKAHEQYLRGKDLSRFIERKRRLLTLEEGKVRGPPPEDEPNVYDFYARRVQSVIRGWLARCFVRWYRHVSEQAIRVMQSCVRGWFGRMRVRRLRLRYKAATEIQKNFRGWLTRGTSAALAKKQSLFKKAIIIQRYWRGLTGRRRAKSKQALDLAAKQAYDAVDAKSLVASDVKELGKRIQYAITEPTTTAMPPDEVLYLIRLAVMVIQGVRGPLGLADYDFFNQRHYDELSGDELDWRRAYKMLNRSERFIRLIRAVAFGPGAKPPRLIQLPSAGNELFQAQANNPRWNITTFERLGLGSRICAQLFKWLTSMVEVATRQQEFISLIATSFPDWLPKLNEQQQTARQCEFEVEINKKALSILSELETAKKMEAEDIYVELISKEIKLIKRQSNESKQRLREILGEIDKMKSDQAAREVVALNAMEVKVTEALELLNELSVAFKETSDLANAGDRAAMEKLSELRLELTNQRLKSSELDAQRKLLEIQVESNKAKRKDPAKLTNEILLRCVLAGEAKAAHVIASVDAKAMLRNAGFKYASDLPMHLVDIYDNLAAIENQRKVEARKRFVAAETERKSYDEYLSQASAANEVKEQKSKDRMTPTEEELEEERLEDEAEAILERNKHLQYLPDEVLYGGLPPKPRPVIICLSRDLPVGVKRALYDEITRLVPGEFILVDDPNNEEEEELEINAMQSVLTAKKNVITFVDHGLTRMSRDSFLQRLSLATQALYPSPLVALAVGDESNMRPEYVPAAANDNDNATKVIEKGVESTDLLRLRDGRIKVALEHMSFLLHRLENDASIRKLCLTRVHDINAPSHSFALVLEAIFVLLQGESNIRHPDPNMMSPQQSWNITKKMVVEPRNLANSLRQIRRGSSRFEMITCMHSYLQHPFWPLPYSEQRTSDPLAETLALYLETFVDCEQRSLQGGGVPLQAFTKSSMAGLAAVITVHDGYSSQVAPRGSSGRGSVGYIEAAAGLVRAAVQDLRVVKTVVRIPTSDPYNSTGSGSGSTRNNCSSSNINSNNSVSCAVGVYRDLNRIFFEAYDPSTSQLYLTQLQAVDVPALLAPNAQQMASTGYDKNMPVSPRDMYDKLLKLMRFERPVGSSDRVLVIKRELTMLTRVVRKIDGHRIVLTVSEGALRSLSIVAHLPLLSRRLTAMLGPIERLRWLRRLNKSNHTNRGEEEDDNSHIVETSSAEQAEEQRLVTQEDARPIVAYVLDRLMLHPPAPFLSSFNCDKQTTHDTAAAASLMLSLRVRVHGPPGKLLFRSVENVYGARVLLEVREITATGTMLIRGYEPISRHTMDMVSISHYCRLSLGLLSDGSTFNARASQCLRLRLMKRLRLNWHHVDNNENNNSSCSSGSSSHTNNNNNYKSYRQLQWKLDGTVFTRIVRLPNVRQSSSSSSSSSTSMSTKGGLRLVMTIAVIDEYRAAITFHDPLQSLSFMAELDGAMMMTLIDSPTAAEQVEQAVAGYTVDDERVRLVLDNITTNVAVEEEHYLHDSRGGGGGDDDHSSQHDHNMIDYVQQVFLHPQRLEVFLIRLCWYLQPISSLSSSSPHGLSQGLFTPPPCPINFKFLPIVNNTNNNAASLAAVKVDTSLRYRQRLQIEQAIPSTGDTASMRRTRCQVPVIIIEQELARMALIKAEAAANRAREDADKAQQLEEQLKAMDRAAQARAIAETTRRVTMDLVHAAAEDHIAQKNPSLPSMIRPAIVSSGLDPIAISDPSSDATDDSHSSSLIAKDQWRLLLKLGCPVTFKDGRVSWQGTVAVSCYGDDCWLPGHGKGRRYRFGVYEPNSALRLEGTIRNGKHLREVLGVRGGDLLDPVKEKEMLIFICRHRLVLFTLRPALTPVSEEQVVTAEAIAAAAVKSSVEEAEAKSKKVSYRVDFESDRLYSGTDKVTPINAAEKEDDQANAAKLLDITQARGKKILRLVRRVSGVLMQLTVFELPQEVSMASLAASPVPGLMIVNEDIVQQQEEEEGQFPYPAHLTEGGDEIINRVDGFVEYRDPKTLRNLSKHPPPALRIVGYDPRSKRKVSLAAAPQAVIEVVGGVFSPYLAPNKRRDLAKVVCDTLLLHFPGTNGPSSSTGGTAADDGNKDKYKQIDSKGDQSDPPAAKQKSKGAVFEMILPWSGAEVQVLSTAEAKRDGKDNKVSGRSSAEMVLQRRGRLFRAVVKLGRLELLLSLFKHQLPQHTQVMMEESNSSQDETLIFNFYSPAAAQAVEVIVTAVQLKERMQGKHLLQFNEGAVRATAIRHFCRSYFRAEIIEDLLDPSIRTLSVALRPLEQGFVGDYQQIGVPAPGEDKRPVGIPGVFFPLDTIGNPLHRRGVTLKHRPPQLMDRDFLVTIFTKSKIEGPERGLVIQLYDRAAAYTATLHIGASELMRMADFVDEPDLLRDLVEAREALEAEAAADDIAASFAEFTVQGELQKKHDALLKVLTDLVIADLGFFMSPQQTALPYIVSNPKQITPVLEN